MRKIYSLVLLAAMLLVGTKAWADDPIPVNNGNFVTEWYNASSGATLQLQGDVTLSESLWLGTETKSEGARSITLDLNGHTLECTARHLVLLTHGELFVVNTGNGGKILHNFSRVSSGVKTCGETFMLCGSANEDINPKTSTSYFSHLNIDEGVIIDASQGLNAIVVDVLENVITTGHSYSDCPRANSITYHTNIFGSTNGVAHGVRIDVKGSIIAYKYAYKTNGNVRHPYEYKDPITGTEFSGMTKDATDTAYTPYLHIYPSASLTVTSSELTDAGGQAIAVYSSGYSRMLIEGNCAGNVGVYAKSGDIELHNATITSTNEKVSNPTETQSGSKAQGSAVIVQSTGAGSGEINLTVTGDTEISATSGYGIQETVTKPNDNTGSYTSNVTVESGTISGGGAGAIAVTTKDGDNYVVTVASGNISGNIVSQTVDESGAATADTTRISLATIVSDTVNTHTTVVYTSGGDSVLVVNPGKATATEAASIYTAHVTNHKDTIKWTGTEETISVNMELKELEINDKTNTQVLTIGNNAVVKIGKVILGSKAQIVVTPGAKLIVTGADGIYSRENSNLVLQANSNSQATFIIGSGVRSNRQPQAKVEYTLLGYQDNATTWKWQRFSTPMCKTAKPDNNSAIVQPTYISGNSLKTYGQIIDEETETWSEITRWADFRPFHAGSLTTNASNAGDKYITYTFSGKLIGNVTDSISRRPAKWNYYGNSFMAPMSTKALINAIQTKSQPIEGTIWFWDMDHQVYKTYNNVMGEFDVEEDLLTIKALSFFVTRNASAVAGDFDIDYDNTIYDFAMNPNNYLSAPMRRSSNSNTVKISMTSENGAADVVYMLENSNYTADYENGADIEKLMNEGINIYAADENYNYNLMASDDMEGTLLSINTNDDINYTLTFSSIRGEVYALRDNMTNTVVLMNEGATYNFTAQPNATLEGRFQIVSRQEMPTAVETVEETVNTPKAIYTVMGQYVGETTDWNNLPAGVYVVDGVKVIK